MEHSEQGACGHHHKFIKQGKLIVAVLHAFDQVYDKRLEQIDQRQDIVPVKVLIFEEVFEGADPEVGLEGDEKENAGVDKAVVLPIVLD